MAGAKDDRGKKRRYSGDREQSPERIGERLKGNVFKVIVGPEGATEEWEVHEKVLAQSPVLTALCRPCWMEGATKNINLPEDDPRVFALCLEYLYGQRWDNPKEDESATQKMDKWAALYIVADKYQLDRLKDSVILQLEADIYELPKSTFFTGMHYIYEHVYSSDRKIRNTFEQHAPHFLERMNDANVKELKGLVEEGGTFAVDLVAVMSRGYVSVDEIALTGEELRAAKETVQILRQKHEEHHANYKKCDCRNVV